MEKSNIFVIIPAYNEQKIISRVLDDFKDLDYQVVVIDDGSTDNTVEEVIKFGKIHLLEHLINRGQGASLMTGISYARKKGADIIVTYDADGQHEVGDIINLIKPLQAHECDVVLGSRFVNSSPAQNVPFTRKVLLKMAILFTKIMTGLAITDTHNGLRAMTRLAASKIKLQHDRMAHASEILEEIARNKLTYKEVPVSINYSEYSLKKGQKFFDFVRILIKLLIYKLK